MSEKRRIEFKFPLRIEKRSYNEGYEYCLLDRILNEIATVEFDETKSSVRNWSPSIRRYFAKRLLLFRKVKSDLEQLHRIEESPVVTAKLSDEEYAELINQKSGSDE